MAAFRISRRSFLHTGAGAMLVVGTGAAACSDTTNDEARDIDGDLDTQSDGDSGATDASFDSADVSNDNTPLDATDTDVIENADGGDATDTDVIEASAITKGPWMMVSQPGQIALLAETAAGATLIFEWRTQGSDAYTELEVETRSRDIDFRFPPTAELLTEFPDLPGSYTVHRAELAGAPAGTMCQWRVREGDRVTAEGVVAAGAAAGAAFRFAWIADTSAPSSTDVAAVLATESFDLFVHGGDIQYRTALVDTWNGMFHTFSDVFRRAPVHFTIGNHEFEASSESGDIEDPEYDQTFRWLFPQQGEPTGTTEYHAFTWGSVRFLVLNSEDDLFAADGTQMQWLRAELEATRENPDLRYAIVGFHRPYYTFGNSGPNLDKRAVMHALMVEFGVPLVLTGHNHSYERFVVDGVSYVVDGGGGAIVGSPDVWLEFTRENRPEEVEQRRAASSTHGASFFAISEDGTIEGWRVNTRNEEEDRYVIAMR